MNDRELVEYIERHTVEIVAARFSAFDAVPGKMTVLFAVLLPIAVGFLLDLKSALLMFAAMMLIIALEIGLATIGYWLEMAAKAKALHALALSRQRTFISADDSLAGGPASTNPGDA